MKRALILLLFVSLAPFAHGYDDPLMELQREGERMLDAGNAREALTLFKKGYTLAGESDDARAQAKFAFYVGLTRETLAASAVDGADRLLEMAMRDYATAIALDPPFGAARNNLARLQARIGDVAGAEASYAELMKLESAPRYPFYCANFGDFLVEQGRSSEAARWYGKAVRLQPENEDLHRRVIALGDPRLGADYLRSITEAHPRRAATGAIELLAKATDRTELLLIAANALAREEGDPGTLQSDPAWPALSRLAPADAGAAELQNLIAGVNLREEAFPWWSYSRDRSDAFRALAARYGTWHREKGALDRAELYLKLASSFGRGVDPDAFMQLADVYFRRGDLEGLRKISNEFSPELYAGKGAAYYDLNWERIYRFHRALGTMYTMLEQWGDSSRIDSAIFQLERARMAADNFNRETADPARQITVDTRIVDNLALAYTRTNQTARVLDLRTVAAEEYVRKGKGYAAETVLKPIDSKAIETATPEQIDRVNRLRTNVKLEPVANLNVRATQVNVNTNAPASNEPAANRVADKATLRAMRATRVTLADRSAFDEAMASAIESALAQMVASGTKGNVAPSEDLRRYGIEAVFINDDGSGTIDLRQTNGVRRIAFATGR